MIIAFEADNSIDETSSLYAADVPSGRRLCVWRRLSRGVGHLLHVRFNVRPEITIFELASDDAA